MAILGIFCHRLDRVGKKCQKLESLEQSEALAFSLQRLLGNFSHVQHPRLLQWWMLNMAKVYMTEAKTEKNRSTLIFSTAALL